MKRKPEYYANKPTTLYDLLALYDKSVEIITQDKNGKIIECFTVEEAKEFPYHKLFDFVVIERTYAPATNRLLVKIDYEESEDAKPVYKHYTDTGATYITSEPKESEDTE